MYKKGFTLAEVLITVGLIGVLAVIALPAIFGNKPNELKTKYLKCYNTLVTLTDDILGNSELYYKDYQRNQAGEILLTNGAPTDLCPNGGLSCISSNRIQNQDQVRYGLLVQGYQTIDKFPRIFASHLDVQQNPGMTCAATASGRRCSFTTTDGTAWQFDSALNNNLLTTVVTIDLDPSVNNAMGNNTFAQNQNNPDQFTFRIDNDGQVTATDELGQEFLKNQNGMHNFKEEKRAAKAVYDLNHPAANNE